MDNIVFLPAHDLARAIREGAVSSLEVIETYLNQIARYNPALNAIITLNEERARALAKQADAALAQGEIWGALHGVPITVKDLFATAGLRTTFSYKPHANYIPQRSVTVVSRLESAGAIILGKTNLPSRGFDFQTVSPIFGRTNNPWDLRYTPGGSTGGGAAAVAAGLSPLEIANDLGGSSRIPAHFCGVFAFKPTEHRVSTSAPGRFRSLRHMLVPAPIARSVEDLRLCLSIIEGPDSRESEVPPLPTEAFQSRQLQDYRFAWTDDFGVPVTQETRATLEMLAVKLAALGCRTERCCPEKFDFTEAWRTFGEILSCEFGVGQPATMRFLTSKLSKLIPSQVIPGGPIVQGFIRGSTLSMRKYVEALSRRDILIEAMEEFLSKWDGWICPVTPGTAFTHRQTSNIFRSPLEVDQQKIPYWMWGLAYSSIFSLTGNPVVILPIGQTKEGLPIGVQLVGRRWRDMELLNIAEKLVKVTGAFQHPPGY